MQLITLTSDIGIQQPVMAAVHGRILSQLPDARVVDLSHSIPPFDIQQAAYSFQQAYLHFPAGSFHFVFCDIYGSASTQLLYVFENGQHILCTDNGFLTLLFPDKSIQIYRFLESVSPFHLIHIADAFIGQITSIQRGIQDAFVSIGMQDIVVRKMANPIESPDTLEAKVLAIDRFGNVILNIRRQQFEQMAQGRKFRLLFMRHEEIDRLSVNYHDVPEGEKLCRFTWDGYLEIAIHHGSAADLFGFSMQADKALFYQTIKIQFL